jgi:hypothetical protein
VPEVPLRHQSSRHETRPTARATTTPSSMPTRHHPPPHSGGSADCSDNDRASSLLPTRHRRLLSYQRETARSLAYERGSPVFTRTCTATAMTVHPCEGFRPPLHGRPSKITKSSLIKDFNADIHAAPRVNSAPYLDLDF